MPVAPKQPVTVGDLRVCNFSPEGLPFYQLVTVADLVSALRADLRLPQIMEGMGLSRRFEINRFLDALAEAQPFPPAGGSDGAS